MLRKLPNKLLLRKLNFIGFEDVSKISRVSFEKFVKLITCHFGYYIYIL